MNTMLTAATRTGMALLLGGLLAAGCGQKPAPPAGATDPVVEPPTATSREFGDHVLYFNAIRTDSLTPEVASSYGIVRSANRALVNISMAKRAEGAAGIPVPGTVTVEVVNLNGQFKDLTVREIREGEAIYYIGDVSVANDETLVFTVSATPVGTSTPLSVKFQRQFVGG
jgi:hypothetical protein